MNLLDIIKVNIKTEKGIIIMPQNELDVYLFNEGKNYHSYNTFGAHFVKEEESFGVRFTLWAPAAEKVVVVGEFNDWNDSLHPMIQMKDEGVWHIFIPDLHEGQLYKYKITAKDGSSFYKADPFAFAAEKPPGTASKLYYLDGYKWQDDSWLEKRKKTEPYTAPINIYEMHLQSWKHEGERSLTYVELASKLVDYIKEYGYTHVEMMPVMEHPYGGSWGYQATGYFGATSRFGSPKDLMYLVDELHKANIGVIFDWVPCHFCNDEHGLRRFDGSKLYEHEDPKFADNETWGTTNFDYAKTQVQSFLISNALFFFEKYHVDGLRVDAVAFMLYQGYTTSQSETNEYAVKLLQNLNTEVFAAYPDVLMMAEESSSWPMVTAPVDKGGLGFNFKWNMGWMNDMLEYVETEYDQRHTMHKAITFSLMYAFSENYVLALSHDEVVHGKKSLLNKMPGDYWQKFASLRMFYGYMYAYPGKKLLFMGGEFGQYIEWNYERELDWFLEDYEKHHQLHDFTKSLNHLYLKETDLSIRDNNPSGFEWIDFSDNNQSIISFVRWGEDGSHTIIVCNFTPNSYPDYYLGAPELGHYEVILNTDESIYGGSGYKIEKEYQTEEITHHGKNNRLQIQVPPLGTIYLKYTNNREETQHAKK